ncbi:hypothetical protein EHM69_01860 [candidate division KSB1 bacterium]|nr:MAG: hypothetical protein EHM69_01860 [candidate division KSB1 bacterium]
MDPVTISALAAVGLVVVGVISLFVPKTKRPNPKRWFRHVHPTDNQQLNAADVAEFVRIREEVLASRRRELSEKECKRDLYEAYRHLGAKVPFLCHADWIPARPMPLPKPGERAGKEFPLVIEYNPAAEDDRNRTWTDDVVEKSRKLLPRIGDTNTRLRDYAEAVGRIRQPKTASRKKPKAARAESFEDDQFYNGDCYRLLNLQTEDIQPGHSVRLQLKFGICKYFDYLNTTEVLAHEYARARDKKHDPDTGSSRHYSVRHAIGDWLLELQKRHSGSGLCCLTFIRRPDGRLDALMMDRSRTQVQTAMGTVHVRPAGEFQPLSKSPAHYGEQCDLWWTLLREFAEEVGGHGDMRHQIRSTNDLLKYNGIGAMVEAIKLGTWKTYYLGFGFDPLNYKPEFLLCTIIKQDVFTALFPNFQRDFIEGEGFQDIDWHGTEFTEAAVYGYLRENSILPSAMACLHLAHQHREFLLRETENWYA